MKRSEECNCKNAGGRTLENEGDSPLIGGEEVGGLRFSNLAFLCVSSVSQTTSKRSEEYNCKNAGGRTLEKEWGSPHVGVEGVGWISDILKPHIPLRILTFSSIDSKCCRRGCKAKKLRAAAPQNHSERKFKFFRGKNTLIFGLGTRKKSSDECNCKIAAGRTLENEWSSPRILKPRILLRILTFSSIDSKGCRRGVKQRNRGMLHPRTISKENLNFLGRS
ncbi:hypothetical protein CDAR_546191 [Caerostris darwini]|uniref:Uncharacterized protein n=1 Tax=Caerostris darwini TaxID=1538125 RepID=A0AAV4VDU5_9ARAC|nr:hypothetical protein CDAR_546191 [Caerostris darwini]